MTTHAPQGHIRPRVCAATLALQALAYIAGRSAGAVVRRACR
ncbi:hypothetical protein [Nocardioides sp. REDSEA-S30_B4]|jgi:hypothetical protein|nr:hypothetical protein [Nocardioides sp. REDSEA-S30_B4]